MKRQDAVLHQKYPELARRALGLEDQRYLLESRDDDENENQEDEQA
jgi:hypothetical protein